MTDAPASVPAGTDGAAPGRGAAALAVGASGVLWGLSAVVIRGAFNDHVDPFALVQARLAVAGTVLAAALLVFAPRLLRVSAGDLARIAIWSLFGLLLVQAGYFWAVSLAGVATAVFLQYTAPLLTALWERITTRERLGPALLGALGLCLVGVAALLFGGGEHLRLTGLAVVAGLLSSFGNAFMVVYGRTVLDRRSPTTVLLYGMAIALVATLAVRSPSETLGLWPAHGGQVMFVSIGSTLVPFLLYLFGISRLKPTNTIVLAMLEPVVAVLGAWLVLREALTPVQIAGAALVLGGVTVAQLRRSPAPAAASDPTTGELAGG